MPRARASSDRPKDSPGRDARKSMTVTTRSDRRRPGHRSGPAPAAPAAAADRADPKTSARRAWPASPGWMPSARCAAVITSAPGTSTMASSPASMRARTASSMAAAQVGRAWRPGGWGWSSASGRSTGLATTMGVSGWPWRTMSRKAPRGLEHHARAVGGARPAVGPVRDRDDVGGQGGHGLGAGDLAARRARVAQVDEVEAVAAGRHDPPGQGGRARHPALEQRVAVGDPARAHAGRARSSLPPARSARTSGRMPSGR